MATHVDFNSLTSYGPLCSYPQWDTLFAEHKAKMMDNAGLLPIERLGAVLKKDRKKGLRIIQEALSDAITSVLHMDQVEEDVVIRELGVDSMMVVQISVKMQHANGVSLSVMQLLGNQTVASHSEAIVLVFEEKMAEAGMGASSFDTGPMGGLTA